MRSFLMVLLLTWFLNLFMPWWSVLFPSLLVGLWLSETGKKAFSIGVLGAGLAWFGHALYIHFANNAILSTRIADMMQVGSPFLVLLITFVIGGLLGGMGTLMGYLFRKNLRLRTA